MDQYESDLSLSLFGGDLLADLPSPVDTNADLHSLLQDGYQVDILKPEPATAGLPTEQEPSLEGSFLSAEPASNSLLNSRWLDVNTDLLDLLEESQPHDTLISDELVVPLAPAPTNGATALEILQSMANETERALSTTSLSVTGNTNHNSKSHHVAGSSVLRDMLEDKIPGNAPAEGFIELSSCMNVDVDEQLVLEASLAPILSPVSPEDVECLLSSGPCSPSVESTVPLADRNLDHMSNASEDAPEDNSSTDETWLPLSSPQPRAARSRRPSTRRTAPYVTKTKLSKEAKVEERKLRKKQQNRDAALRYRHKKKEEGSTITSECDQLEQRNQELKDKADQLTREIKYLKDLMADVHQAKMLLKLKK